MSDNDPIRRGDALKLIRWGGDVSSIRNAITALPADPRVEKLVEALAGATDMLDRIATGQEWGAIEEQVQDGRAALAAWETGK